MNYQGVVLKSRTLDLAMISQIVDAASLGFLAYSPEQLGIAIPVYMGLRVLLNGTAAYLRFKTSTPVGQK